MATEVKHSPNTVPHPYQDKKYGKNMRVCNSKKTESGGKTKWVDTVTGKEI